MTLKLLFFLRIFFNFKNETKAKSNVFCVFVCVYKCERYLFIYTSQAFDFLKFYFINYPKLVLVEVF